MLFFDSLVGMISENRKRRDLEDLIRVEYKKDYKTLKNCGVLNSSKAMKQFLDAQTRK